MDRNELPLDSRRVGVPLGASKIILRAYVTFGANRATIMR
jgi:hypothetical protein